MCSFFSQEDWTEKAALDAFVKSLSEGPDLRVNKTIKMFTSLNSSYNLMQHYKKRNMEMGGGATDWIQSLVEKLGDLTPAPELAGLGALAIAIIIDTSSGPPEESTKEALRCVFAEKKASKVWDHIDECLKRCLMHINNTEELVGDIEQIEVQLRSQNEDSEWFKITSGSNQGRYFEVYYDHRYDRQRCDIQQDFTQVKENLQQLVHQRGSFNMN